MKFVPRREKNRKAFSSPDGLALLGRASASAKANNAEFKADPWNNVGAEQRNNYREPMASVTVTSPKKKDTNNGN